MKSNQLITSLLAALALAAVHAPAASAEDSSSVLKFSDPTKPGTLKINLMGGDVRIQGADGPDITVFSDSKANSSQKRSDGLRVLTASNSFNFTEKDNVAILDAGYSRRHSSNSSFKITVPKNTALVISNQFGDTSCTGIGGDIEVRSNSGSVTLRDVSAGASVEDLNGSIHVNVAALRPDHALSFSSMNGEILIRLPEASKANLQLRTQNGTILTDFDDKDLVTKTSSDGPNTSDDQIRAAVRQAADAGRRAAAAAREAARAALSDGSGPSATPMPPLPPLPPMTGGQIVSGTLHGGGTTIQAATMNGDVTVRKE